MKLTGHADGIAALKAIHAEDKEYMKFLVGEAKSNADLKASFKTKDGRKFVLKVDLVTGDLDVEPAS
ncbi:MAG: hypothetical protein HY903_22835 [Deltaproteobacteria bacterium]|nr:hypothetical protein [Deltaproteobacteria bacterium]